MARSNDDLPTLVAQTGPLNGQRWTLQRSTVIGRENTCDIIIPTRQVSRFHARLTPTPDGTILEDLSSKNGTHCNGLQVSDPVTLQDGDMIQIALAQQFVYLSSDATLPLDTDLVGDFTILSANRALHIDKLAHRVWIKELEIVPPLSVSQFQLLEMLYDHQGNVVTRTALIEKVWGEDNAVGVSEQALDALVRRLRDRLAMVDPNHQYIVTVRGHGLRLDNPSNS